MLNLKGRTRRIASASIFAVLYSLARLIPVSPYVGISSALTFGETISPLSGILFGPYVGGFSVVIGTYLDFALGRPIIFDGLDFLPGAIASITAGFCYRGKVIYAIFLQALLMLVFTIDPLSPRFIQLGYIAVPYLWLHITSLAIMTLIYKLRNRFSATNWIFVASTFLLSTMASHVMGGIVYENILVRVNRVISPSALGALWVTIFYLYPVERLVFTLIGTFIALAVIRSIPKAYKKY